MLGLNKQEMRIALMGLLTLLLARSLALLSEADHRQSQK